MYQEGETKTEKDFKMTKKYCDLNIGMRELLGEGK